jgi:hypothetical protein
LFRRKPFGGMNPQKEARAVAAKVHLLDKALERNDPDLVEDWRRDLRHPHGRRQFSRKNRAKPAKEKKRDLLRAGMISLSAERHGRGRDKPKRRFAIGVKIKGRPPCRPRPAAKEMAGEAQPPSRRPARKPPKVAQA